jgi:hypothetical protein
MWRQESVRRGLVGVSLAGRRVMFSGRWGQRRVRNQFMIMRVPVGRRLLRILMSHWMLGAGKVWIRRGELQGSAPWRGLRVGESCWGGELEGYRCLRSVSNGSADQSQCLSNACTTFARWHDQLAWACGEEHPLLELPFGSDGQIPGSADSLRSQ